MTRILAPETRVMMRACDHVEPAPAVVLNHVGNCTECGEPCYAIELQPSGMLLRCCGSCLLSLN
jgi:hypothetical protein